jgi:hypothetical protein
MTEEVDTRETASNATGRGRRYKPHELHLAGGGRLTVSADGEIDHLDARGATVRRWKVDDPEWPDQAIRFGLYPQAGTITPHGQVQGTKPPRR